MNVIEDITQVDQDFSLLMGNFDGVHTGHQQIIKQVQEKLESTKLLILTFVPHPLKILKGENHFLLNTYKERQDLLRSHDVDYLYEVPFNRDLSTLSPKDFLDKYLANSKNLKKVFVGYDFAFGANKEGDLNFLKKYFENSSVEVVPLSEFKKENESTSSTDVRNALVSGDVKKANLLLGREYFIKGRVVKGKGRGKQIGFPTANIEFNQDLITPSFGVYATKVRINNSLYNSITNIGVNPTFSDVDGVNIETHILDFDNDIYGEDLTVLFDQKIRDEKKFDTVNSLIEQIKRDIDLRKDL